MQKIEGYAIYLLLPYHYFTIRNRMKSTELLKEIINNFRIFIIPIMFKAKKIIINYKIDFIQYNPEITIVIVIIIFVIPIIINIYYIILIIKILSMIVIEFIVNS